MKIKIITLFSLGLLNIGSSNVPLQNNNSIATAHPLASEAGNKMYTLGGNAADAAVAAGFTLAVVEPSMSGIGGRLQAIIKNDKEETIGIDASTEVPASYINDSKESNGYKTIGIPGVVAGLLEIHEKYGSLPLSVVMEPAISHAEKGFYLLEGEKLRQSFAKTAIANYNGTAHHFITLNIPNDKFIQKDLSNTLKRIKDKGSAGFYSGITAQRIVHDMQINGGFVTLQDLKNYKVKKSKVLKTQYKGFDIETLFLPSYGAITINILNILNNFNLNELSELNEVIITANAIKIGYSKRAYQQNPDSLENILSKMEGLKSANKIKKGYQSNYTLSENDPKMWSEKLGHTSHLTTADKNGMVVSLTQTIGPLMGSKVATKGL
jgi:gamma-glutamyltranspeptidase/glutathione hydrolase